MTVPNAPSAHSRFYQIRRRLENYQPQGRLNAAAWEFFLFGFKQGWACLFGGLMLGLLLTTKWLWTPDFPLARYDFLFLAALAIQAALLIGKMETLAEAKVILVFHIVGTIMELFKTHAGSWAYPETNFLRIAGVPLFSGFMYAAVGSYIARATRIFDLRYQNYPVFWHSIALTAAIYANFFTHHFLPDLRWGLFALIALLYGRTMVCYRPYRVTRRMPLLVGFSLVALFIWLGENIGCFTATWLYPHQQHGWKLVPVAKFGSWYMLMIISFVLVTLVHRPQPPLDHALIAEGEGVSL